MTRLLDRIAWEIYARTPLHWEAVGRKGLRAWLARRCSDRVRTALNERRFIP